MDLLSPPRDGSVSGISRAFLGAAAAAALAFGVAWPSAVAWKAKTDLAMFDARVAALRPSAGRCRRDPLGSRRRPGTDRRAAGRGVGVRGDAADPPGADGPAPERHLAPRAPGGGEESGSRGAFSVGQRDLPALARDGRFRSVEFGAPITRQADNIERFKIRGEFVPPPPSLPASPPAGAAR